MIKKIEGSKYEVAVEDRATKSWKLKDEPMTWDAATKRPKFNFADIYTGLSNLRAYFDQQLAAEQRAGCGGDGQEDGRGREGESPNGLCGGDGDGRRE